MVARGLLSLVIAVPLAFALSLTGCETDPPASDDLGVPDLGIFIACDPANGTQTNPACPANLPQCHPAAQICVGCIPSSQTCLPGFQCSQDSYVCEPIDPSKPCTRNVDCPLRLDGADPLAITCDVTTGKCQECVTDEDCVDPVSGGVGVCGMTSHTCNPADGGT